MRRWSRSIIEGIHGAFSLATAQTFWLGVFGSIVALVAAVAIKEVPLRTTNEQPVYGETPAGGIPGRRGPVGIRVRGHPAVAQARRQPAPSTD